MQLEPETRRSGLAGTVFVAVALSILAYLALAGLQGRHGVISLLRVEAEEERLALVISDLKTRREALENKTRRLSAETLDPDLLDEQARRVLGFGRADEIILH
jgi:cell division protein FtsB